MAKGKQKISTDGGEDFGASPFGALELGGLPAGPAKPAPARAGRAKAAKLGRVEVRREKAGRGGKTVTTLKAFAAHTPLKELEALTFELKKGCACGGTLKGRVIELQGDVVDRVLGELSKRGFQPVRSGG